MSCVVWCGVRCVEAVEFGDLFKAIPSSEFRFDISSTELRCVVVCCVCGVVLWVVCVVRLWRVVCVLCVWCGCVRS